MGLASQLEISGYQHSIYFQILIYLLILAQFILHSNSISLQHRNFAIEYGKQKIYISIAWIIWIVWLPRGNPWSGKTPKASELFPVAIPQSSCQAESDNKIMVSTHHPLPDPMTVQMKLKLKSLKSSKSSQLQRKSSQSVLEFHEKMRGFTDHARGGSIASGFGTWGSASAPGSSGQHKAAQFVPKNPKIENVNLGTPSKTGSTRNINSSQCDIHVRLVSWIQSPGSTTVEKRLWVKFLNARREHRELDPKEPKMSGVTFVSNV